MGDGGCPLVRVLFFYGSENGKKKKKHKVTEHHSPDSFVVSYCYASCKPSPTMDNFKKCSRRVRGREESGEKEETSPPTTCVDDSHGDVHAF